MMHSDTFVGSLALLLSVAAACVAAGPIQHATRLRSLRYFRERFGELGARLVVALVASILLLLGVMILRDVRPTYATFTVGNRESADNDQHSR